MDGEINELWRLMQNCKKMDKKEKTVKLFPQLAMGEDDNNKDSE